MANEFVAKNGLISQKNSTVSGSLTVTQGITGSLFGTASWATNVLTASFLPVNTYNITSSWAVSASQAISASRATTSSFALTASFLPVNTYNVTSSWATNALTSSRILGGTTNYIPLWDTNNSLSSSVIYQSGSNIGIGNTSPTAKLHIGTSTSFLKVTPNWLGTGTWLDLSTDGPSGLGSGGPGVNAWIAYASDQGQWFTNSLAGDIVYRNVNGRLMFGNTGGKAGMALSNDKLGIGTVTPSYELEVSGSGHITNGLTVTGSTIIDVVGSVLTPVTGSIQFNGTNDYLTFSPGYNPDDIGGTGYLINCWFKLTEDTFANSVPILYSSNDPNNNLSIRIKSTLDAIEVKASSLIQFSLPYTLQQNIWYYLTVGYRGSTNTNFLYLNGTASIDTHPDAPNISSPALDTIGYNHSGNYFPGYITNLRLIGAPTSDTFSSANLVPTSSLGLADNNTSLLLLASSNSTYLDDTAGQQSVTAGGGSPSYANDNPYFYYANGPITEFSINDSLIKTNYSGSDRGLKIDFSSSKYSFGDFNNTSGSTKLIINDVTQTISIKGATNITGSLTVSGSSTFTNIGPAVFSGSVTSTQGFSGSFSGSFAGSMTNADTASYVTGSVFGLTNPATSASYAVTASYAMNGGGSVDTSNLVTTSSFNSFTSSVNTFTSSILSFTQSINNATSSFITNNQTSSFTTTSSFNSFTSSVNTFTQSINNATSSFVTTSSFNTYTSSINLFTSSILTFTQSINNITSSFLTTGSFGNTQTISGSLVIDQNLTVLGTQSVQYITSSQLNISTNLITVNTATPAIRFGGLAVYDSGSTGTGRTGSILWDSQENVWIYTNPSGATYDGGMFLVGPRTMTMGTDVGISQGYVAIGDGSHHMTSSQIYNSGSLIRLETNTEITGSLNVSAGITGSLQGIATTASYISPTFISASAAASGFGSGGGDTSGLLSTSSFNSYTGSSSSQFAGTASYATTASYAMNGGGGGGGGITQGQVVAIVTGYSNLF